MDKLIQYQKVIITLLHEFASAQKSLTPGVKSYVVTDTDNHQYQLLSIGWHNDQYVYTIAFHFSIVNNKIWIQQNNTDVLIAEELIQRGVNKEDIVLGSISENMRQFSGYAVA